MRGKGGRTGVEDTGDGGLEGEADPTGDRPNSSKSGVSMISIGSENVVSSVLVWEGDVAFRPPRTFFAVVVPGTWVVFVVVVVEEEVGTAGAVVVVAMLVMGRDSRRGRTAAALKVAAAAAAEEEEEE